MNGGSAGGMFGNAGVAGVRYSVATMGSAMMSRRLSKIVGIALVLFTATYFLLPFSSSFVPLERLSPPLEMLVGLMYFRDNEEFIDVYESLFETLRSQ